MDLASPADGHDPRVESCEVLGGTSGRRMDSHSFRRALCIVEAAVGIAPVDRARFLDEQCAGDSLQRYGLSYDSVPITLRLTV